MASTAVHMPRPTVKRAALTWPGDSTRRSHFEDFLREIGADPDSTHLCCKGTSPHPHGHVHTHKGSTTSLGSKARLSPSRTGDKARASPEGASGHHHHHSQTQGRTAMARGRTMSTPRVAAPMSPAIPIAPKSPALSYIDLETHDATPSFNYLSSARDALLTVVGSTPVDERPSRSPTRSFFRDRAPVSRSPDSDSSPPPFPSASERSRSYTRNRSASRTPSIDSLDTASSSEAPATPRMHNNVLAHELPSLDDLERASRFRVQSTCTHCHRAGSNFPSCAKCGERWCSRECRRASTSVHAHACHGRAASA
ncbi:uncharacterized protein TRAVEDRAFT_46782 [Trametes versicolor FP-101664 SS1]|uniref:uncharacterized protein n=1 Tax=Trametes versicolor (strain FP-101664) TaxID=717944 RepID=UPI0004622A7A|nr:uncharacterized protein TRAVEDRAFT_46782 [Trametes versicolor FP-101664 SS1]EIW59476.1 hypothetical protein TRAVEDRAFT_46782 [Trametes versicolor FP-101664 SS1]